MSPRRSFVAFVVQSALLSRLCCTISQMEAAAAEPHAVSDRATSIETSVLPQFIRRYSADRSSVGRFYELPWSPVRFDRMEKVFRDWQDRLQGLEFDALDQQGRIDYALLHIQLKSERDRLALDRRRLAELEELLPFRKTVQDLEQARWRMESVDAQKTASSISTIPEQIKRLRQRLEKGKKEKKATDESTRGGSGTTTSEAKDAAESDKKPVKNATKEKADKKDEVPPLKISASLAHRAASAVGEVRGTLKNWAGFYDGFVPEFSWWMKKPNEEALAAMDDYAKFLREEIAGIKGKDEDPLVGDAIGAESLADDLANEMIPYTADELIAIGEKEFSWCEARMKEAAKEMGFGDDWKAALTKVKNDLTPPGKQDAVVLDEARQAIQFVKDKNLITVPPLAEELWRMTMLQPDAQKTMPYAAYSGPNMLVAYAKDEMKHDDKLMSMRGNNRHFMHIVTPHELIPGHHLQLFMAARNREYRSLFYTPFLVEGWSLYWELILWDMNYGRTPEDRIGMLFWRMHRCARIIVSLKFHLGQMTPQEMVDFLVDRVGHERFGATSEVRRFIAGGYSPLYQCGYMIGGMQLKALRREIVETGKMTDRQFNDAVLTYGPIPIEMIRAGLLNVTLTRDFKPSWKFAGANPGAKNAAN